MGPNLPENLPPEALDPRHHPAESLPLSETAAVLGNALRPREFAASVGEPRNVLIMGAAGRDFFNFLVRFRDDPTVVVRAFTATQIPGIESRRFPASLSGPLYPEGIPIFPEEDLPQLIARFEIDEVVFSYSDVDYSYVMHRASLANALGADFVLLGTRETMLKANVPVIAVTAVRTGSGKSQTTRRLAQILMARGKKVVVVRHPMPYGELEEQAVERFAKYEDLEKYKATIEEREEYEPHIEKGIVVYAGIDYERILREAEREAEIIIWDGGNNDTPFYKPDLHIVVADPLRHGHELSYYPGETNFRMADVVVINKVDTATPENVEVVKRNVREVNPDAVVVEAASPITPDETVQIRGKTVLAIEDGPTLTHGGMEYGAAYIAAQRFGAAEIVSAVGHAVGSIKETYKKYPNSRKVLPAMGYGPKQIKELEQTIDSHPGDLVRSGTPIDLSRGLETKKRVVHVR